MSQSARDLALPSIIKTQKYYEVTELYNMSRGRKQEWGIEGYCVPKTTQYIERVNKFPKDKRQDAMTTASKRSKEPDPTKYSPDLKASQKQNWIQTGGKFYAGKKITIIDEVMEKSKKFPGPGDYFKEEKKPTIKENHSKSDRTSFLSTVEALSSEIPCSWKYFPDAKNDKRKHSDWIKSKDPVLKEKEKVGPGYYETVIKGKNSTLPNSKKYSFPKAKSPDAISLTAYYTRNNPGVGKYLEAYNSTSLAYLATTKSTKKIIHPYKTKRFLEDVIKFSGTVPGPGTYDIGPPKPKKEKLAT